MFVFIMLTMTLGIGSLVFISWLTTAEETTEQIAESISDSIYDQVASLINVPEHINEVNCKILENGGNFWYYAVNEDLTAGELVLQAGLFDARTRAWFQAAVEAEAAISPPHLQTFCNG